ncbi:MAG: hypothetical protein J2P17_16530 [Mycobacterium sp.]|nr:hypothetical protein [Mycobacterium sp.]
MSDAFNAVARLRVTPAGLRSQSGACEALAGELSAASAPSVAASTWQANAGAVNVSNARTAKAMATFVTRTQTTATKLTLAAGVYERQDAQSAATLAKLGMPPIV